MRRIKDQMEDTERALESEATCVEVLRQGDEEMIEVIRAYMK